jgi:negative regulator of flagellin synthesis FlgM
LVSLLENRPTGNTFVKIDKRITPPAASKVSAAKGKAAAKTAAPSAAGSDSLTLTESSTRIRALESQLAAVEVTDLGKVESVKAALANGTFAVDAEVVADRLIDHTKETLRKRPRKK